MNVLMVGVDKTSIGGMLTVVENYWNSEFFCKKTNLRYIPSVINKSPLIKILYFLIAFLRIFACILLHQIDIVHIHMAERTSVYREGLVAKFAKILRCKVIIHMHGADIEQWYDSLGSIKKKITRYFISCADKVIILGENWRSFMERIVSNKKRIEVVYNAVDVPPYNKYNPDAKNIIFLGMIIPRKGILDLLDALKSIELQLPKDIKVLLYGNDKNKNIQALISERNLEKRVSFCGWLDGKNRACCFQTAIINVLPSYHEGLPMSILETMAYGVPNISTTIAAIPEVIKNGENGMIVNPGDVSSLANAILYLATEKKLRKKFSEASYETICKKFAIEQHLNHIISLYETVLS